MPQKYEIEKSKDQMTRKEAMDREIEVFKDADKLNYDEAIITRLRGQAFDELDAIIQERSNIGYDEFCDAQDNQCEGKMPRREGAQFNVDSGITKRIIKDVVRTTIQAFFGVDPIATIKPRPGTAKAKGVESLDNLEDFVDYAFDEKIPFKDPFRRAVLSACTKKVGWTKWFHKIQTEKRVRQETYQPEIETRKGPGDQAIRVNKGVENFVKAHGPEIEKNPEKYLWVINKLEGIVNEGDEPKIEGGSPVTLDVEYDDIVYNDPYPKFVDTKNFFARVATDGYQGLIETQLMAERVEFSYYELKKMEEELEFFEVDRLLHEEGSEEIRDKAKTETYTLWEMVFKWREKDPKTTNDEDNPERKIICFFSEDRKHFLGGIYYPLTVLDCYYVPHYAAKGKNTGLYQASISEDITDKHIAKNAILNFTLEAAYIANTVTPITPEGSDLDVQFARGRWTHGMTLNADPKKGNIDFLNKYMRPPDISGLLVLGNEIERSADGVTGSTGLRTGRESPLDPSAPASKTIALLERSGISIKDYVEELEIGFAIDINCVLRIYYDISNSDQLFISRRAETVTGEEDPFKKISKFEMIAKAVIEPMAHTFDFDELNAKREDIAFWQMFRSEPMFARRPESIHRMIMIIAKGWSPKYRNEIERLMPTVEEFRAEQAQLAVQAVNQYVQAVLQQTVEGVDPKFDPAQLVAVMQQFLKDSTTQPSKEELKARENAGQ